MSKTRRIKLSLDKFISFLERYSYILIAVYCEEKNIQFVECRTPRQQKTFIVYLPEKYIMVVPSESLASAKTLERLNISSTNALPLSQQIEFMSDMKGVLLECDLVDISRDAGCI